MATLHKAICKCKGKSESDLVSAIEKAPWHILHAILTVCTVGVWGAFWIITIIWHKMIPEYQCQMCKATIPRKQLRV